MEFLNILWIFLLIASIYPVVRQKMIESARYRLIQELERKRGTRVIAMIHRQESMSILGFPGCVVCNPAFLGRDSVGHGSRRIGRHCLVGAYRRFCVRSGSRQTI